jgi:GNAT superfamily N-acetyltransferase
MQNLNIFMMCEQVNQSAFTPMPDGFHVRNLAESDFDTWKKFPFNDPGTAREYDQNMIESFEITNGRRKQEFFEKTVFVCDKDHSPVATCLLWRAYEKIYTVHWFKTLLSHEGIGIGRALLSLILRGVTAEHYPILLHTHPESFRAVKLYSDFGFALLSGDRLGARQNDLQASLPMLKKNMPAKAFQALKLVQTPKAIQDLLGDVTTDEF